MIQSEVEQMLERYAGLSLGRFFLPRMIVVIGHLPAGLEPGRPGQFRSQQSNGNPT